MLIVCDTNIWIDAALDDCSPESKLLSACKEAKFRVAVSKHSLSELEAAQLKYGPAAFQLANSYEVLPYYPVGTIKQLLGKISELAGTLADMKTSAERLKLLSSLAKRGTGLRDCGALIDSLYANAQVFVTCDRGMVGSMPKARIEQAFPIRIRTATEFLHEVSPAPAGEG